jgi:hypothetical protein
MSWLRRTRRVIGTSLASASAPAAERAAACGGVLAQLPRVSEIWGCSTSRPALRDGVRRSRLTGSSPG